MNDLRLVVAGDDGSAQSKAGMMMAEALFPEEPDAHRLHLSCRNSEDTDWAAYLSGILRDVRPERITLITNEMQAVAPCRTISGICMAQDSACFLWAGLRYSVTAPDGRYLK